MTQTQTTLIPMLGISGYSGSGKTTLLEKLLPALQQFGLKVAVIKHTHHNVQTDKPGKDSWRMKEAGASQVVIASDERWALLTETPQAVELDYLRRQCDPLLTDLILVEGFKHEALPKLFVHRQAMSKPLPALDDYVLALVCDYPVDVDKVRLDLNDISAISGFIHHWFRQQSTTQ